MLSKSFRAPLHRLAVGLVVGACSVGLGAAILATSWWGLLGLALAMIGAWGLCAAGVVALYHHASASAPAPVQRQAVADDEAADDALSA